MSRPNLALDEPVPSPEIAAQARALYAETRAALAPEEADDAR